jgi:dTDP-4-dehydrorhamnose reductase
MKVLVLGAEGMLGHKVLQALREQFADAACTVRGALDQPFYRAIPLFDAGRTLPNVDVMDQAALRALLRDLAPEVIVNCVGVIKQRPQASVALPTIAINSLLPHLLASWSRDWSGRVIHFSTDCVFSGRTGAYTEESPSDAEDLYGKSKYLGEVQGDNALTLRTSIIGRELAEFRSLLEWFLAQRGKQVRGFTRVIYSGVTTNHMAKLVARLIGERPDLHGLYQVASKPIAKHDLLCLLRDAYRLDVDILPEEGEVSDRSMLGDKFVRETGMITPSWPELAAELAGDRTPYDQWRKPT